MFSERRRPYLEGLRSAPSLCRILPMPPPVHHYDTQLCRSMNTRRCPRKRSEKDLAAVAELGGGRLVLLALEAVH